MSAVLRIISLFQDSPTYGRDRANLISGFTIGTTSLLLNGAVLMLVLPLMLDPDDRDFRSITENVEFGQLLALILLGGATAFATFLIPMRLMGVFLGPRIGRYFDQIVLSGISPLRFVIGKATSQNLFLCLILFLLLPYLVLSVTLGGMEPGTFVAGVFLIWLYCMTLAMVTLWASLYFNEILAALLIIGAAIFLSVLGFAPLPIQPFVVTPFPALIHPVYRSIPSLEGMIAPDFLPIFLSCAAGMTVLILVSLFAIYMGPLYGIIGENSTFGEVVRSGDSRRKRWFRLRLHIQRPSEIAFFYENRSNRFRRVEGLVRWGTGWSGLTLLSVGAYATLMIIVSQIVSARGGTLPSRWFAYDFHATCLSIHGVGMVLAMLLFSHAKNSTYLRIPVCLGRSAQVSHLDTSCFVLFAVVSTTVAIATPFGFESYLALPADQTLFPDHVFGPGTPEINFYRVSIEGSLVLTLAGIVVYSLHRLGCLLTWMRSISLVVTAGVYAFTICFLPLIISAILLRTRDLHNLQLLTDLGMVLGMMSPFMVIMNLFSELGSMFPATPSSVPFFVVHGLLMVITMMAIRRTGRRVRRLYLSSTASAATNRQETP